MFHLIARVCWYVCTCLSRSLLFSHGLSKCFSLDCMMLKTKNRKRDTDIFLWKRIFENFLTNSWAWDITYFSCSDFVKLWANLLKNERGCSNVFSEKQFKIKDFYIDFGVISPFRTHRLYTKKAIKNEILELTVCFKSSLIRLSCENRLFIYSVSWFSSGFWQPCPNMSSHPS